MLCSFRFYCRSFNNDGIGGIAKMSSSAIAFWFSARAHFYEFHNFEWFSLRISYDLNFHRKGNKTDFSQRNDPAQGKSLQLFICFFGLISVVYQLNCKRFPWIISFDGSCLDAMIIFNYASPSSLITSYFNLFLKKSDEKIKMHEIIRMIFFTSSSRCPPNGFFLFLKK